ncbi:putative licABCH operon regulator [Grimontia celer]|uniref:Putative licABCH operon regulator n=1 Tax=Grimontia celer TaxID=1796497 RepID=A0A128EVF3_9GAMM|nr:PTS sugar transporter subunit IIA [Grimontia celer]CZF78145.1 putative licABCH operon regulator [Grimontia celer]
MITRRITFFVDEEGLAAWRLNRLKILAGYFRSVTMFCNISQRKQASVEHPIRMMSLSIKPGDLCQLLIEGSDAELASMVLTDFLDEHAHVLSGGKNSAPFEPSNHVTLPFTGCIHRIDKYSLDKHALLAEFALKVSVNESASQEDLFNALYKRESVSATCMGHGIALPHIISPNVSKAHLMIATTALPLDWSSQRGDVTRVIGMMLPAPPVRDHVVAFSGFSQLLLEEHFCRYLTDNQDTDILETIIVHSLSNASV